MLISAKLLLERGEEICVIIEEEIHCTREWSNINLLDSIALIQENAALVTSEVLRGTIQPVEKPTSYALVFNRPLGVVLGIAPWNAPLILGLRAIIAPISAGNTAILKVSAKP
jgi:acyl-CoA reductase-like NAD-dependent aldehyde dehydrogenase